MTTRKRRGVAPDFKLPTPYEPTSGKQAPLKMEWFFPYCAMMQIAAEDTENDYVMCRGFDIRMNVFIEYEDGDDDKPGIPVAKPYGNRRPYAYEIAQVFPAFLPLQTGNPSPTDVDWRVGQNPGVAETSIGHPADLDEAINELSTTDGKLINWMLIDASGGIRLVELCLAEDHPGQSTEFDAYLGVWDPSADGGEGNWEYDECSRTVKAIDHRYGVPYPAAGATGLFTPRQSDNHGTLYECVSLDCSSAGACCP